MRHEEFIGLFLGPKAHVFTSIGIDDINIGAYCLAQFFQGRCFPKYVAYNYPLHYFTLPCNVGLSPGLSQKSAKKTSDGRNNESLPVSIE